MSTTGPSRRERLRTATVTEMRTVARGLLVAGGPAAISLRAIAREMGMTAPAIYRYFPSLDALVVDLIDELFDELRIEVEQARATADAPLPALLEMTRAFRRWSIGHPAEFALVFGTPVPGVGTAAYAEHCFGPDHAGARFGAPFLVEFGALWQGSRFPTPPPALIAERLGPHLGPYREAFGDDAPVEVVYAYLSAWTRLYGLVALEVFGHLRWAVTDVEALFEVELAAFAAQLTATPE